MLIRRVVCGSLAALALCVAAADAHEPPARDAARWRSTLIREVRYHWGVDQDPAYFFAQIHQESRWRETARSPVGATGLGQFMPGTAADMQRYAALREICGEKSGCPLDPRWSLRATVLYNRALWCGVLWTDDETQRWAFTLAGYNSGPGWVRRERLRAVEQGRDGSQWFDPGSEAVCLRRADFCKETRGYVRAILGRWLLLYREWLRR